jgi:hypothetical protein
MTTHCVKKKIYDHSYKISKSSVTYTNSLLIYVEHFIRFWEKSNTLSYNLEIKNTREKDSSNKRVLFLNKILRSNSDIERSNLFE